ncbi:hypothetical protein M758_UG336400 [Ceratodon purpureus]|nr:hypothetical protein M758_UG336400 [Ceratodon purpureus]
MPWFVILEDVQSVAALVMNFKAAALAPSYSLLCRVLLHLDCRSQSPLLITTTPRILFQIPRCPMHPVLHPRLCNPQRHRISDSSGTHAQPQLILRHLGRNKPLTSRSLLNPSLARRPQLQREEGFNELHTENILSPDASYPSGTTRDRKGQLWRTRVPLLGKPVPSAARNGGPGIPLK